MLIRDLLHEHFGATPLEDLEVARAEFPLWMRVDVLREIESIVEPIPGHRFTGARIPEGGPDFRFADLLDDGPGGICTAPPAYVETTPGCEDSRWLVRGLWLGVEAGAPFALLLDFYESDFSTRLWMELAVPRGEAAARLSRAYRKRIREAGARAPALRGKVLVPRPDRNAYGIGPVDFEVAALDPVARDGIVLAPGLLERIEKSTLGFAARAAELVSLGMSARRGILLFGPPGTGKTLLARYLAVRLQGHTVFLLAGEGIEHLAQTVEAARLLQPSLVVIEDADLVGADREGPWQHKPATLNTLLNAMDGLAPDAQVMFLLTTNRIEKLEPALAQRPGRVDQVFEIGLPAERERCELLRRFAARVPLEDATAEHAARRVGSVSPAFIKELVRRAAQEMLDRGATRIEEQDLERGLEELGRRTGGVVLGRGRVGFVG